MGGLDDVTEESVKQEKTNVVSFEDRTVKRKPFHYWQVGDREFQLKLTSRWIEKVESKYGKSIFALIMEDDLPPLSAMLTVIQAAMSPWEHGITYQKLQGIYDSWVEEGGNQMDLLTRVVIPTLAVSGFFTGKQAAEMESRMESMDDMI